MQTVKVVIKDEVGLHARPANKFVRKAATFSSDIRLTKEGSEESFNAKSITSILRLGAVKDTLLTITAEGADEEQACKELEALVVNNFED